MNCELSLWPSIVLVSDIVFGTNNFSASLKRVNNRLDSLDTDRLVMF